MVDQLMPYLESLPRWLRMIGRALRVSSYLLLALAGLGDLTAPSSALEALGWGRHLLGGALLGVGVIAAVAVVLHRWRWEWTLAFWLAFVMTFRAWVAWTLTGPPPPLSSGSLTTFIAVALILRGLDLTVFAFRTSAWRWRLRRG